MFIYLLNIINNKTISSISDFLKKTNVYYLIKYIKLLKAKLL